ncbi:MAG: cytochrome c oxidase cbb3-type subunit 3 [Paracoccaceae bacterium]|jgi:cytochrome c oxidase cbb3-type subunit 3
MSDHKDIDEMSGIETTGHDWNGIKELNNPLPLWWLYSFYACVIWAMLYTIAYPAWPMISSATTGVLGYSSRGDVAADIAQATAAQSVYVDKIATMELADISADAELNQFALAGGGAVFRTYCSQCHGAGAAGAVGYPNLNDDDWIWGGEAEDIRLTIAHGIRSAEDDDTRDSAMPAFGKDELLEKTEIAQVVEHVLAISSQQHDAAMAETGAVLFEENCAACHGAAGGGVVEMGAPNLADAIWLYGGDRDAITYTINNARAGMMPAWLGRITDAQVKQVALYVHGLGGGQ